MEFKRFLGNLTKSFLVVSALSVSAFAGADTNYNQAGCVQPCAPVCNTAGSCCGVPCCEPPACGWAYNPPGYCHCNCNPTNGCDSCDGGWGLELDFLWWRACETGIALGNEEEFEKFQNNTSQSTFTRINESHVKTPDFKYDPGFRVGLYNTCACECWDIGLIYTHYHTKASTTGNTTFDHTNNNIPETIFYNYWERAVQAQNPSGFSLPYVADHAKARYSLTMDWLDLEFGRKYYVSSCFVLRPAFGLRGAKIDQTYRVDADASRISVQSTPGNDFVSQVKARNDFLAIGPRVGLDAEVHLGCGFALFGEAAGSILFGRFERHSKEHLLDYTTQGGATDEFFYETSNGHERCSRAVTDLSFGFKWSRCFDWCNRLHPVSVAFAWEHHAFWNFNNFNFVPNVDFIQTSQVVATGSRKSGDLYTQGLTLKASFGF